MKILLVFIDMICVDYLLLYNDNMEKILLDLFFENLGGIILINCYIFVFDILRSIVCL